MSVTISTGSDTATAYLTGEIDHHTAAIIRADIDSAIEKQHPGTLVIDFSGVTSCNIILTVCHNLHFSRQNKGIKCNIQALSGQISGPRPGIV